MARGPLEGVRVLDLTRYLAGPFATMLLGDYGADVVKLEPREGREFRAPGSERDSYFFLSSNRGKRSATLDLRKPRGREILLRMLEGADVLVENFRPGVMASGAWRRIAARALSQARLLRNLGFWGGRSVRRASWL